MIAKFLTVLLLGAAIAPAIATEPAAGAMLGAKKSETPGWFKQSFLEFEEDVAEAAEAGRRVMIYFHQEGCPYCAKLVKESFNDRETGAYMRENFDAITIDMWGDREVVSIGGRDFTEKTFAAALKVQYTPTLLFLDERGKTVLRLDGYYPPHEFRAALNFVAQRHENRVKFSEYMRDTRQASSGGIIGENFFVKSARLDRLIETGDTALAVYFESSNCADCRVMHQKILTDATTRKLVIQMQNLQLDIESDAIITRPDGKRSSVSQWANELGIAYTPSVVFFDNGGVEIMRIGAFMKTFHFQSVYDYVLTKAYLQEPSFQRFLSGRAEQIREAGFSTDIWGYDSSH